MTFKLTRGETFSLALEELDGADLTGATCEADLKLSLGGRKPPGDAVPPVAEFTVIASAEVVPNGGAGWLLTLSPTETAALLPNQNYLVDAKITLASGFIEITDLQEVSVFERVTQ